LDLLFYGGFFIGFCASALTALTVDLFAQPNVHLSYIAWIGTATAALYCGHRLIGLHHIQNVQSSVRFQAVRNWRNVIIILGLLWAALSFYFLFRIFDFNLLWMVLPGGAIAMAYILPIFGHRRRLRDLGWFKIILIALSWSWLTAFVPAYHLTGSDPDISLLHGVERFLFIFAITIPFEIRDIAIDRAAGLQTLPVKLGKPWTTCLVWSTCISMVVISFFIGHSVHSVPYFLSHCMTGVLIIIFYYRSWRTQDDYFFSGAVDGLMILVWILYLALEMI
jgi:4-hydroxybenzoate polyprenyltransferase